MCSREREGTKLAGLRLGIASEYSSRDDPVYDENEQRHGEAKEETPRQGQALVVDGDSVDEVGGGAVAGHLDRGDGRG